MTVAHPAVSSSSTVHFSYMLSGILLWNCRLVDAYSVRSEDTLLKLPHWARIRCQVVGDLFSDAVGSSPVAHSRSASTTLEEQVVPVVGLLPGSKVSFYCYSAFVLILQAVLMLECQFFTNYQPLTLAMLGHLYYKTP